MHYTDSNSDSMDTTSCTLVGKKVSLIPLELGQIDQLCEIGLDPDLWHWVPTKVTSKGEMFRYIESALNDQKNNLALPFAILDNDSSHIIGSTRLYVVSRRDNCAEIGWCWIAKPWQGTSVNTESKFLLLKHAFDSWKCSRVEFTADARNEQSRAALIRVGAKLEGTLRKNRIMPDGKLRDTIVLSIIDDEWPGMRQKLLDRLANF